MATAALDDWEALALALSLFVEVVAEAAPVLLESVLLAAVSDPEPDAEAEAMAVPLEAEAVAVLVMEPEEDEE